MKINQTIKTYDQYAQVYDDEVADFWNNFPEAFIDNFVSLLPGRRILNLGSGSGRDSILLRNQGLEVVCVDASKAMIAITKSLGFESHLITFSEMNFPQSYFDGTWAYTSLIHISKSEAEEIIAKIHKALKPKGVFAVGAIEGNTAEMVKRKTMPGLKRYFKKYTNEELLQLIEQNGFKYQFGLGYRPHKSNFLNQIYIKN